MRSLMFGRKPVVYVFATLVGLCTSGSLVSYEVPSCITPVQQLPCPRALSRDSFYVNHRSTRKVCKCVHKSFASKNGKNNVVDNQQRQQQERYYARPKIIEKSEVQANGIL